MNNDYLQYVLKFIGLVLLQVLLLNNICFLGYINPYFYIYLILTLPSSINKDVILLIGFILGLTIDIFCDTLGCHIFATTLIAYLKPYFHKLFGPRDEYEALIPSIRSFGVGDFLKYTFSMVITHHLAFFFVETLSFSHFFHTLVVALGCTLFTILLIYVVQRLIVK
jgi:rod shape-determining protein MreD